jgi:hypothetical protein
MAEKTSFTKEDVKEIVNAAVRAAISAATPKPPDPFNPDEAHALVKANLNPPGTPERREKFVSEETGASATAVIVPSHTYAAGRLIRLEDYTYPKDIEDRVPNGMNQKRKSSESGALIETPEFKQWRYESFWQLDLKRYVGRDAADPVVKRCLVRAAE